MRLGGGGRRGRHSRRRGRRRPAGDHRTRADQPARLGSRLLPAPRGDRAPPGGWRSARTRATWSTSGEAQRLRCSGSLRQPAAPISGVRLRPAGGTRPRGRCANCSVGICRCRLGVSSPRRPRGSRRPDKSPFLARLLRHSLLLTQAEVSRLDDDHWPSLDARSTSSRSNAAPEQLAARTPATAAVSYQLPAYAQQGSSNEQYPPDPRVLAIVRQFRDVRQCGAAGWPGMGDSTCSKADRWRPAVAAVLRHVEPPHRPVDHGPRDTPPPPTGSPATYRAAWGRTAGSTTSAPGHRSRRRRPPQGCFTRRGRAQALAAAVLRDHAVHDADARWQITARSDLVRLAAKLGADVRLGIHLSRGARPRDRAARRRPGRCPRPCAGSSRRGPSRPDAASATGCEVLDADPADVPPEVGPLDDLRARARHVRRPARRRRRPRRRLRAGGTGAGVDGSRRGPRSPPGAPAAPHPAPGRHPCGPPCWSPCRCVEVEPSLAVSRTADPALAELLQAGDRACDRLDLDDGRARSVTLADLGLDVPDVVVTAQPQLDAHRGCAAGRRADRRNRGGPPKRALDRLCSLLGAQRGVPEVAGRRLAPAEVELRDALAALRAAAATVIGELSARRRRSRPTPAAGGLPTDPAAAIDRAPGAR